MLSKSMYVTILSSIFILQITSSTESVFAVIRHGARSPYVDVTDFYKTLGAIEPYDLTSVGVSQNAQLAMEFIKRYGKHEPKDVVFYADDVQRCRKSMESFIESYFNGKIETRKKIIGDSFFQPFNYHTFDNKQWAEIGWENKDFEELYAQAKKHKFEPAARKLVADYSEPTTPYLKLKMMNKLYHMYSCNLANKAPLDFYTDDLMKVLLQSRNELSNIQFPDKQRAVNFTKHIFKVLRKHLKNSIKISIDDELSEYPTASNTFMFAHDSNIVPMLMVLLDKENVVKDIDMIPDFSDSLIFETFKAKPEQKGLMTAGNGETFVKVLFKFKELKMKFCPEPYCTVAQFVEFIDKLNI